MRGQFRSRDVRLAAAVLALAVGMGCSESPVARVEQPVVYGDDDRQDVYAHPNAELRALAQSSVVALMREDMLDMSDPAHVRFNSTATLSSAMGLCGGQRFENDPAVAFCSGTLIAPDLVLSAGHCFTAPESDAGSDTSTCANTRFVFKYWNEAEGRLATITSADVFSCAEIVTRVQRRNADGTRDDYSVVRLDRAAAPRFTPARIARDNGPARVGQSVTVIGCGSGIPAKIDSGGAVIDLRSDTRDYFIANTDTFGGNSGSGVFATDTRDLIGILVRGATDYVLSSGGDCYVVNECPSTPEAPDCGGESINYVRLAFDDVCARLPTHSLCAPADAGVADAGAPDVSVDVAVSSDVATPVDVPVPDVVTPVDASAPDVVTADEAPVDVSAPDVAAPDVVTADVAAADVAPVDVPATPDVVEPADVATDAVTTDAAMSTDAATTDVATVADAHADAAPPSTSSQYSGCSVTHASHRRPSAAWLALAAIALAFNRRRRPLSAGNTTRAARSGRCRA